MSKGIKSFPEDMRKSVVRRREQLGTLGLGYWGARDALKKMEEPKQK